MTQAIHSRCQKAAAAVDVNENVHARSIGVQNLPDVVVVFYFVSRKPMEVPIIPVFGLSQYTRELHARSFHISMGYGNNRCNDRTVHVEKLSLTWQTCSTQRGLPVYAEAFAFDSSDAHSEVVVMKSHIGCTATGPMSKTNQTHSQSLRWTIKESM